MKGYGSGLWGSMPWGGPSLLLGPPLAVAALAAVRENMLRVEFSEPIEWTGIGDVRDGSDISHYVAAAVPGTVGMDAVPVRATRAVLVERTSAEVVGASNYGRFVDVWLDRPMSPFPAEYTLTFLNLYAVGSPVPMSGSGQTFAAYRQLANALPESTLPATDIANPQTLSAFFDPLPIPAQEFLGTFNYDENGDYGTDEGTVSLRKRVLRRLITRKGSFVFLPDYGVGVPSEAKRLNSAATRGRIADEVVRQLKKEPEVDRCACTIVSDPVNPGLVRFRILVKTKQGKSVKYNVPFVTV